MKWPGGARCAFNLGFDMDADTIWRNKTGRYPHGADYIKGPSIGQYGPLTGVYHILDILDEFGLKGTFFIPALAVEKYASTVETIIGRGHEISHHGYDHRGEYGEDFEAQRERFLLCSGIFMRVAGVRPLGVRQTGPLLPETERWLYNEGGYTYASNGTSGEACEFYLVDGEPTKAVNIPCRDEQTDDYTQTVFHTWPAVLEGMPRIAAFDTVCRNWMREIEGCIRFGNAGSTAFHPQISGTPGRSMLLRQFCRYLADSEDVWCAPCRDIAEWAARELGERPGEERQS